jgi:hypothetical protein
MGFRPQFWLQFTRHPRYAFVASLALHSLLLVSLMLTARMPARGVPVSRKLIVELRDDSRVRLNDQRSHLTATTAEPIAGKMPAARTRTLDKSALKARQPVFESSGTGLAARDFVPSMHIGPPIDHDSDSAIAFGNKLDLARSNELAPFLLRIYERVDSRLAVDWGLMEDQATVAVSLDVELGRNGKLRRVISAESSHLAIRARVVTSVQEALAEPLPALPAWPVAFGDRITVGLSFVFVSTSSDLVPEGLAVKIARNQLSFFRARYAPGLFVAYKTPADERGKLFGVRLELLYKLLFKGRSESTDPTRIKWDLNLRLTESAAACDHGAEGACVESGKIQEAFGEPAKALGSYERGCSLGYELACAEQARLKGK